MSRSIAIVLTAWAVFISGCIEHSDKQLSRFYQLRITTKSLGDNSVQLSLWGRGQGEGYKQLAAQVKGLVAVNALDGGSTIVYAAFLDGPRSSATRLYVCSDGRSAIDVSERVVAQFKERGVIGYDAILGRHFVFRGAKVSGERVEVFLEWWRSDIEPLGESLVFDWKEIERRTN